MKNLKYALIITIAAFSVISCDSPENQYISLYKPVAEKQICSGLLPQNDFVAKDKIQEKIAAFLAEKKYLIETEIQVAHSIMGYEIKDGFSWTDKAADILDKDGQICYAQTKINKVISVEEENTNLVNVTFQIKQSPLKWARSGPQPLSSDAVILRRARFALNITTDKWELVD